MPNIDCDEQETRPHPTVVVKQEADDDNGYDACYESQCEPTSTSEKSRTSQEASNKRHSADKCHPGIENVVEKLKKNAAALQETAPVIASRHDDVVPDHERITENVRWRRHSDAVPESRSLKKLHLLRSCESSLTTAETVADGARWRRHSETSPERRSVKKLHLLRSCASSLEGVDAEVSSSQNALSEQRARTALPERRTPPTRPDEDGRAAFSGGCDSSKECPLLGDNNNDSRSNNNNIKAHEESKNPPLRRYEKVRDVTAGYKPKTIWSHEEEEMERLERRDAEDRERSRTATRQRPAAVDLSGLVLLSNSIVEMEQGGSGQLKHHRTQSEDIADRTSLSIENKLMNRRQSEGNNNNNVNSPLGLLCALAEQRLVEEVGDHPHKSARGRPGPESSEEISRAGRLLLNLGRGGGGGGGGGRVEQDGKRRCRETDDGPSQSKRFKLNDERGEEEVGEDVAATAGRAARKEPALRAKENAAEKMEVDVAVLDARERALEGREENSYPGVRGGIGVVQDLRASSNGTVEELPRGADVETDELSDHGEVFEPASRPSTSCELEERDAHDYKNSRAKLEAKKFLARKGSRDSEGDWPNMNPNEIDMRVKMADIQRQYREKQKELSKLTPKKDEKKSLGRPRKKSHSFR